MRNWIKFAGKLAAIATVAGMAFAQPSFASAGVSPAHDGRKASHGPVAHSSLSVIKPSTNLGGSKPYRKM